jgi:hypothetical protein
VGRRVECVESIGSGVMTFTGDFIGEMFHFPYLVFLSLICLFIEQWGKGGYE